MIRVVNPLLGPQNGYVLGYAAFGWVSILLVCSFAGSIAARLKSEWLPYRNLVDYVAIAVTLFAILWALFLGPVAGELNQARESANFFRMDASSESPI